VQRANLSVPPVGVAWHATTTPHQEFWQQANSAYQFDFFAMISFLQPDRTN
jgi:hypothetical protein